MDEPIIAIIVFLSMVVAMLISIIPFIPGPAVLWLIGTVFAILNDFQRVPIPSVIIMTILMLVGSTTDIWLRYLGLQSSGGSCWGTLGSLFGGLLGTFFIPVPILGTLIGAVLGALLVEFMRVGQTQQAFRAGWSVLQMYVVGIFVELIVSFLILVVFAASLWLTA